MNFMSMVIYCQTTKMAIMSYFHQNFPKYRKYANSSSLGTSNKPRSGSHSHTQLLISGKLHIQKSKQNRQKSSEYKMLTVQNWHFELFNSGKNYYSIMAKKP